MYQVKGMEVKDGRKIRVLRFQSEVSNSAQYSTGYLSLPDIWYTRISGTTGYVTTGYRALPDWILLD